MDFFRALISFAMRPCRPLSLPVINRASSQNIFKSIRQGLTLRKVSSAGARVYKRNRNKPLLAPSLGSASRTVSEGTAATGPITHTFTGQFFTAGAFVAPTSGTIAFTEAGGGISDILTFSYTGGGGSPAPWRL